MKYPVTVVSKSRKACIIDDVQNIKILKSRREQREWRQNTILYLCIQSLSCIFFHCETKIKHVETIAGKLVFFLQSRSSFNFCFHSYIKVLLRTQASEFLNETTNYWRISRSMLPPQSAIVIKLSAFRPIVFRKRIRNLIRGAV